MSAVFSPPCEENTARIAAGRTKAGFSSSTPATRTRPLPDRPCRPARAPRPRRPGQSHRRHNDGITGGAYILIAFTFALATGIIGRAKGSSFFIWFLVGGVLPVIGLIAVILSRFEKAEPERRCPRCGAVQKLYVQVCRRCGEDLYLPDPAEVRHSGAREAGG